MVRVAENMQSLVSKLCAEGFLGFRTGLLKELSLVNCKWLMLGLLIITASFILWIMM